MNATEAFVKDQIKEAEEKLNEKIATLKEDLEKVKAKQSYAGSWKDKSQIEQYKDKFTLRKKEANTEKPTMKLNDDNFTEFKQQITGWMKALHPLIKKVIESLERPENRTVDDEDIKKRLVGEMRQQAE